MKRLFLDIGHWGSNSGAVANGIKEVDMNEVQVMAAQKVLEDSGKFKIFTTKDISNGDYSVLGRVKTASELRCEAIISFHNNAGGGDGFEAIHSIHLDGLGDELGNEIAYYINEHFHQNIRRVFGRESVKYRGSDYYGIIKHAVKYGLTGLILEGVFLDNKKDLKIMDEKHEQEEYGRLVAKAIMKFYGIVEEVEESTDNSEEFEAWKIKIYEEAFDRGFITSEGWKEKLNEPMEVWAVLAVINNMYEKLK